MTASAISQTYAPDPAPDPALVAAQNDAFRRHVCLGEPRAQPLQGRMVLTRSLVAAENGLAPAAVAAVGSFNTFAPENDPDGWHDFGALDVNGEKILWKLDLYEADSGFRYGAEAPDNPATTIRMLTIMMAADW